MTHRKESLFLAIHEEWEAKSRRQIVILTVRVVVNLDSDGRCDSPGHSAKYSTYNLMDEETGKVVAFQVVQVAEVTSSNATEKEEFTRCIQLLEGKDIRCLYHYFHGQRLSKHQTIWCVASLKVGGKEAD